MSAQKSAIRAGQTSSHSDGGPIHVLPPLLALTFDGVIKFERMPVSAYMKNIFVDKPKEFGSFKVDKCEALGMEGSPADEEGNNNGG